MGIYLRWLLTYVCASVYDCFGLPACAYEEGTKLLGVLPQRFLRIMPPFIFFMVLYSTLPMLWGQIDGEQSMNDLSRIWLNFPMLAGHFWFMYPLIGLYLFIPVISPCWRRFRRKKNVSSSDCSWFLLAYLSSTVGLVRCGDSASGTNITCYGISRVIWATLCWHIISACILLGGVPCVCGSVSCLCWSGRWLPYGRSYVQAVSGSGSFYAGH